VWNVVTGACERVIEGHTSSVHSICALPDGRVAGLTARELVELFASALSVPSDEIDAVLGEPSTTT
jgi:WD40 repeat protein